MAEDKLIKNTDDNTTEIEVIEIEGYKIGTYEVEYIERIKGLYGFIYVTTNLINGKMYVGQRTIQRIWNKNSWKTYLGSGTHLHNAIKKYGRENFSRKIIDIAFDADELNKLEYFYTVKFNSVDNEQWYNLCYGGGVDGLNKDNKKIQKKVVQYDLNGNFIKEYKSLNEASRDNNLCRNSIKNCCIGTQFKTDDRTTWRYKGDSFDKFGLEEFIQPTKSVVQYDLNLNYISTYSGVREAERQTSIDRSTIIRCCKKKQQTAGGYKWFYTNDPAQPDKTKIILKEE